MSASGFLHGEQLIGQAQEFAMLESLHNPVALPIIALAL
jgi:hypothetical protein